MGELRESHVKPMSAKDYERTGFIDTARIVKAGERSTFRRKLIGVALAVGALTGLVGIPKLENHDGTPNDQVNHPENATLDQVSKRNLNDISGDISIIKEELENKTP